MKLVQARVCLHTSADRAGTLRNWTDGTSPMRGQTSAVKLGDGATHSKAHVDPRLSLEEGARVLCRVKGMAERTAALCMDSGPQHDAVVKAMSETLARAYHAITRAGQLNADDVKHGAVVRR